MTPFSNSLLSVAEAYKAMSTPPAESRPSWVPQSITEVARVNDFVSRVKLALEHGHDTVIFEGKTYRLGKKVTEESSAELKHDNVSDKQSKEDEMEKLGEKGPDCWDGYKKVGTKPGTGENEGETVNDCEKISEEEGEEKVAQTPDAKKNGTDIDATPDDEDDTLDESLSNPDYPSLSLQEKAQYHAKMAKHFTEKSIALSSASPATEISESVFNDAHSATVRAQNATNRAHTEIYSAKNHAAAADSHIEAAHAHKKAAAKISANPEMQKAHLAGAHFHSLMAIAHGGPSEVKESTEKASEGPKKEDQEKLEPKSAGEKKFADSHEKEVVDGTPKESADGSEKVKKAEKPSADASSKAGVKADVVAPVELPAGAEDATKKASAPSTH